MGFSQLMSMGAQLGCYSVLLQISPLHLYKNDFHLCKGWWYLLDNMLEKFLTNTKAKQENETAHFTQGLISLYSSNTNNPKMCKCPESTGWFLLTFQIGCIYTAV